MFNFKGVPPHDPIKGKLVEDGWNTRTKDGSNTRTKKTSDEQILDESKQDSFIYITFTVRF